MWTVLLLDPVEEWYRDLADTDEDATNAVDAAIDLLESEGPTLGRPLVDRLKGSKRHNLKELRPSGSNIRILFIFDPERQAVLLAAGDKTGDWSGWYRKNIPIAENRYDTWLREREENDG